MAAHGRRHVRGPTICLQFRHIQFFLKSLYFPIPLPLASVEFTNNGKSKPSTAWLESDERKPQRPWS
jgi:hypothetical protein